MRVVVVHGPPLSGKTTYVLTNKLPGDLVYDYDLIMSALTGSNMYDHDITIDSYAIQIRKLLIESAALSEQPGTLWVIINTLSKQLRRELMGTTVEYIKLDPGREVVQARLEESPGGRSKDLWSRYIDDYYGKEFKTETREDNPFYKSERWRNKRIAILKRDVYKCKECSRYGKSVTATTVHHIKPLEEHKELGLVSRNLVSLCDACHNRMHNRATNELTKLGQDWIRRVWGE